MGLKTTRIDAMPPLADHEPFAVIAAGDTIDVASVADRLQHDLPPRKSKHVPRGGCTAVRKAIHWHAGRELVIADLKGSRTDGPGIANSFVGLHHELRILPLNVAVVKVRTCFDPGLSYFKRSEHDDFMLMHERLMFDLVELHARELRRQLQQEGLSRRMRGTICWRCVTGYGMTW